MLRKIDVVFCLLPQLLLHLVVLVIEPESVAYHPSEQLYDPSSQLPFSTALAAAGVYAAKSGLGISPAGDQAVFAAGKQDKTRLLPVPWSNCTAAATARMASGCRFPVGSVSTFMPGRANVADHFLSPCETYTEASDSLDARLTDVQTMSTYTLVVLAAVTLLTLWVSRKDRLRHEVRQASTITCEIQKIAFPMPQEDPTVFVTATMLPDREMQQTETFALKGQVGCIVPEKDSVESLMHFTLHPHATNVLYLELWSVRAHVNDGEPKLLGHHQIPIDEVKWFKAQDYFVEPTQRPVSELGDYYDQFVGYHWVRWVFIIFHWAAGAVNLVWGGLVGFFCKCGDYATDDVAAIRCEFSIPSGAITGVSSGSLSLTEQVMVGRPGGSMDTPVPAGALRPQPVGGRLVV